MGDYQWLSFDLFDGRTGEPFELSVPGSAPVALRLVAAREGSEPGGLGPDGRARLQFSLTFQGPTAPVLPQATYAVRHDQLGDLDLFLVPVGRDDDGTLYEAAFA